MTFRRVLLRGVLAASCLLAGSTLSAWAGPPTVLTPPLGEKAYALASEALADVWEKVTGQRPVVRVWGAAADPDQDSRQKLPDGDLVLIGSDAVHPLVHQLIREGALESLGIGYETWLGTNKVEVQASTKIVNALLEMFSELK